MFDEHEARDKIRDLMNETLMDAGLSEGEGASIAADVLSDLASE